MMACEISSPWMLQEAVQTKDEHVDQFSYYHLTRYGAHYNRIHYDSPDGVVTADCRVSSALECTCIRQKPWKPCTTRGKILNILYSNMIRGEFVCIYGPA